MKAEDTITASGSLRATVHPLRRDIGPCREVYKPALSAWFSICQCEKVLMLVPLTLY